MLFVEAVAAVPPRRNLRANRSRRDGTAERERRGDGGNGFRALADTLNGDVAVVHKAAKNALVNIDTLNFVERHFEGPPLDETSFVDHRIGQSTINLLTKGRANVCLPCRAIERAIGLSHHLVRLSLGDCPSGQLSLIRFLSSDACAPTTTVHSPHGLSLSRQGPYPARRLPSRLEASHD